MQTHNGECLSYWSGFYSTYPQLKFASRSSTSLLQTAHQILTSVYSHRTFLKNHNIEIDWENMWMKILSLHNATSILQVRSL
jgi:hypothetical protein